MRGILDDYQRAMDATVDGKLVDPGWGDLDDISELILKRHLVFKSKKLYSIAGRYIDVPNFPIDRRFEVEERGDLSVGHNRIPQAGLIVKRYFGLWSSTPISLYFGTSCTFLLLLDVESDYGQKWPPLFELLNQKLLARYQNFRSSLSTMKDLQRIVPYLDRPILKPSA